MKFYCKECKSVQVESSQIISKMINKSLLIVILFLSIAIYSYAQVKGTFTDLRDGRTYKTLEICNQTWMAENLAYKAYSGCWAYDGNQNNVIKYGYLYNWETAKIACPSGWHLPDDEEWTTLIDYLGGVEVASRKLKSSGEWTEDEGVINDIGFTALPGGLLYPEGIFDFIGIHGYWLSATLRGRDRVWSRGMTNSDSQVGRYQVNQEFGISVRCVRHSEKTK